MARDELACRELVELVTDYLEGALDAGTRARFEAHLAGCDGCTAYLQQVEQTIVAVGRLREDDLEPDAREALLAAFRSWRSPG